MSISYSTADYLGARPRRSDWKAAAVAAYEPHADGDLLRATLAQRLRALLGREVGLEQIWVDLPTAVASVVVDEVLFSWEYGRLIITRPCAHCGVGAFASPALHSLADIGRALSAWSPHHPDCAPVDPD